MLGGPPRDAQGNVNPNRRFPDMKALTDYIHGQGPEGRHLHLARTVDLRPATSARISTRPKTPGSSPSGDSIF